MKTCKHFRFLIPREDADELRDADPEPCPVCDEMPHRRRWLSPDRSPAPAKARQEEEHFVWQE